MMDTLAARNLGIVGGTCPCRRCIDSRPNVFGISFLPNSASIMVVCEHCGNKRCPHATWHENPCTQSNEWGQQGSDYSEVTPWDPGLGFVEKIDLLYPDDEPTPLASSDLSPESATVQP